MAEGYQEDDSHYGQVLFSDVVDDEVEARETTEIERLVYDRGSTRWVLRFRPGTIVVYHVSKGEYECNDFSAMKPSDSKEDDDSHTSIWQLAEVYQTWTHHSYQSQDAHFPPCAS
jgi:hypothetical protein